MFDKFELPKPLDEFKMPPSKGINRKSHIGMLILCTKKWKGGQVSKAIDADVEIA